MIKIPEINGDEYDRMENWLAEMAEADEFDSEEFEIAHGIWACLDWLLDYDEHMLIVVLEFDDLDRFISTGTIRTRMGENGHLDELESVLDSLFFDFCDIRDVRDYSNQGHYERHDQNGRTMFIGQISNPHMKPRMAQ